MSIRISKNAHLCAACGVDFQHGATITSTVKKAEGSLHREDFCKDCWQSERNKEAYSVWNMVYHDPKIESAEPPEVYSPLRQLFYEAAEEESRVEMAKAFLAAGLLRRQKVFRLIKESDEADGNVRVTLYTDRLGNRLIEVPDPQFTYAELDTARALLLERLQALEAAAAEPEPSSEEEGAADVSDVDSTSEAEASPPDEGDDVVSEDGADAVAEEEIVSGESGDGEEEVLSGETDGLAPEDEASEEDPDETNTERLDEEEVLHAQA